MGRCIDPEVVHVMGKEWELVIGLRGRLFQQDLSGRGVGYKHCRRGGRVVCVCVFVFTALTAALTAAFTSSVNVSGGEHESAWPWCRVVCVFLYVWGSGSGGDDRGKITYPYNRYVFNYFGHAGCGVAC